MNEHPPLTVDDLHQAVAGGGAAIRSRTVLQPAGGRGDKVFPPTYATGERTLKYAREMRRIDGREAVTILLDSVASQANRMEEALLQAWDRNAVDFPVITVDFAGREGLEGLDRLTSLEAPHRIADALLRDSVDSEGRPFRETPAGKDFTLASPSNATAVFQLCPTALVFGVWDSTGPRGGLGSKFARALVSEIVAIDAVVGSKVSSRLDPAGIQANVDVFHAKADRDDWTIHEEDAAKEKGKPALFSRKGSEGKGKPSAVNHSNIAPSIDDHAGGVTFDHAVQTTVLSLGALRRLRFPTDPAGKSVPSGERAAAEAAIRTAIAALGLAGVAHLRAAGFDLRSRCTLIPDPGGPMRLEVLPADGGEGAPYSLDAASAAALLAESAARAADLGFRWTREPVKLRPSDKLADLIRRSRELAAAGQVDEEAAEA